MLQAQRPSCRRFSVKTKDQLPIMCDHCNGGHMIADPLHPLFKVTLAQKG